MYDPWADPDEVWDGYYAVPTPVTPEDYPSLVRPDGPPPAVPPELDCEDESFQRIDQHFDEAALVWGTAEKDGRPALVLRVDGERFERGDVVTVTLLNALRRRFEVEFLEVGNRDKYDLQVRTGDGWLDVRSRSDGPGVYTDEGVGIAHGRGYVWRFELGSDSIRDREADDRFAVCPDLPAGRYRFVFWGADPPLGVAFDLVE